MIIKQLKTYIINLNSKATYVDFLYIYFEYVKFLNYYFFQYWKIFFADFFHHIFILRKEFSLKEILLILRNSLNFYAVKDTMLPKC